MRRLESALMYDPKSKPGYLWKYGCYHLILITILLTVSCAGMAGNRRVDEFSEIIKSYENALENSDYRQASRFVDPSKGRAPVDYKRYANIKIVRHKVTHVEVSDDKRSIEQDVEIQYFLLDRNLLRTMIDHQVWRYKDEGKVWMLQTGLPQIGSIKN
jgi:hypothetical protein